MKRALPSRVLGLLLLCAALATAAPAEPLSTNPFDARAAALEGRVRAAASAPQQAALLLQLRAVRDYVDDAAGLDARLAAYPAAALDETLLAAARAEAAAGDAHGLEALALLEHAAGTGEPLAHMRAAAERRPTTERWLKVARWSAEQRHVFDALTRALAAEPHSAAAHVAFADYYAGRGQTRKALDLLRHAVRLAPGDFVARKRLADVLLSLGRDAEAAAEFARLAQSPRPLWLRRELALYLEERGELARAEALLEGVLVESFYDTVARAALLRIYERRGDAAGLRRALEEMAALAPASPEPLARLAALDEAAGDRSAAERRLRAALARAPDDAAARRQLAALLAPNEAAAFTSSTREEDAYLVDAGALAREAQRASEDDAGAVSLAEVRVVRVAANGLATRRVQQVIHVASAAAAREHATRDIQFAPATEELRILRARVHKRNARIVDAVEAGESAVADESVAMYYDVRARHLRFRGLEPGDVLELDYRIAPHARSNPYGDYYGELLAFQSGLPQRFQRFVLLTPAGRDFHIASERMPEPRVTVAGGERHHIWELRDLPGLPREPRGPAVSEVAPYLHISSFGSWRELGEWYAALVRPQFAPDPGLREALVQAVRGADDELARIHAIHQYVLRNTHYVALEFGVYSYKPYPVAQTLARRFGDCKDKASLMMALLRAAGVEAELALVRTRRLGDVSEDAASMAVFNHAIVYVPKYDLWLDGTAEYAGSRELPLDDQGALALTVALDGRSALRRIPVTRPEDNYTRRVVTAELRSDGRLAFSGSAYARGEDAPGLRREYELPERRLDVFRARLAEVLPAVQVEDVRVDGTHDLEHDVTVNFRGTLDSYLGQRSIALRPTWMPRDYLARLAPLSRRTQPLLLAAPWTTEEELHFTLPRGARVVSLPAGRSLQTDFGSAAVSYELRGRELRVRTSVVFRETRIAAARYAEFRRFCADLERAFRDEIKVALP